MGMHQYLKSLSDLEMINRAPGYFKFEKHTVAAHSFKVAQAAQLLGDIEENAGNEVNWRSLYEKALNHDYTERFIGDIKTPVKYATPALRSMLAEVDQSLTDNFIDNEIPQEFQAAYRRRFGEGKDSSLEGKILSVADKIDLMYESFGEIQKGNPEPVYMEIYRESLRTMMDFKKMASVQYFLNEILPELLADNVNESNQLTTISNQIIAQYKE
ncbi:YfbR-like 5'-deoxynucleotidase [Paucilactobacillus kaifaensis]|uniref:YfbR-like 5'-deoxynucleotidase n=1 Tax=Paucilactobacillus kaifaensis TaxID=2559921 RepID=UPI0010F9DA56|nr:YfbR-like 5'-deoxynucleotidase [Paucilactobacillus kaifaensis]